MHLHSTEQEDREGFAFLESDPQLWGSWAAPHCVPAPRHGNTAHWKACYFLQPHWHWSSFYNGYLLLSLFQLPLWVLGILWKNVMHTSMVWDNINPEWGSPSTLVLSRSSWKQGSENSMFLSFPHPSPLCLQTGSSALYTSALAVPSANRASCSSLGAHTISPISMSCPLLTPFVLLSTWFSLPEILPICSIHASEFWKVPLTNRCLSFPLSL